MEEYIPLIIVILISIIGAVSRKKKRHEVENISTPGHRNSSDDDFLGWLEKLNIDGDNSLFSKEKSIGEYDNEEIISEKSLVVEESVKKDVIPNIFSKYSGFISPEERENMMSKEGISTLNRRGVSEGDLTKQATKDLEVNEIKSKFEIDLKNAVIYNEILNRKYV